MRKVAKPKETMGMARMPRPLLKAVRIYAAKMGVSQHSLVTEAVEYFVDEHIWDHRVEELTGKEWWEEERKGNGA